jgi:O-antigen/teichoic acid export membrane protein
MNNADDSAPVSPEAPVGSEVSIQAAPPTEVPAPEASTVAEDPASPAAGGAKTAAVWTVVGFVVMQVMRFGSNIILARLLVPEIFGLMALVMAFIQGLHLFSDVGLAQGITQSKRGDDRDFLDTAWTIKVMRGFVLWITAWSIAWPVSVFYHPLLLWLLPIVGFNAVIDGFSSTAIMTLGRRLYRGRLMLMEITTYALSQGMVIAWAFHWQSVWPLVFGNTFATSIYVAMSFFLIPGERNRFRWDRSAVAELLHFGKWIYLSTAFTFFAGQADRLVVGKLSLALLGVYHFGAMLASMPALLMYAFQSQLLFPLYSRYHQNNWNMREVYTRFHLVSAGLTGFLISGLIASGPTLVRVLYDSRYFQAGWILQILAIGAWFQALEAADGAVLWALGKPQTSALSNAAKVVALAIFASLGFWLGDLLGGQEASMVGLILGFVAGDLVRYLVTIRVVHAEGMPCLRFDGELSVLIAASSLMTLYVAPILCPYRELAEGQKRDWANDLVRLVIEGALVLVPWLLAAFAAWRLGMFHKPTAPESKVAS